MVFRVYLTGYLRVPLELRAYLTSANNISVLQQWLKHRGHMEGTWKVCALGYQSEDI